MRNYLIVGVLCLMVIMVVGCSTPVEEVPEPAPVVVAEPEQPSVASDEPAQLASSGDISIVGAQGLEPDNLVVSVGSSVAFTNNNPSERDNFKDVVLVIQNKNTRLTEYSGKIMFGETYEHVFNSEGTFSFWTVGYGITGTIVVE